MHVIRKLALLAILAPVGACAGGEVSQSTEADRLALFRADSLFAYETAERGADGWAAHFLIDGVMYPSTGRIDGQGEIRDFMTPALTPDRPSLEWTPTDAAVGAGGDMGYTLGRWVSRVTTPEGGDSTVASGHYVTIWRRDSLGVWRVAVDIGNTD
ncbi:MAG: nuclear transport factor 2 family protein [Gemmatimonadales bacterium]|nr:nuclear transport factor 2 family protein [Gemmatimonadales bacterium]